MKKLLRKLIVTLLAFLHCILFNNMIAKRCNEHVNNIVTDSWTPFLLYDYISEVKTLDFSMESLLMELKKDMDPRSCFEIDNYFKRIIFATFASKSGAFLNYNAWKSLELNTDKDLLNNVKLLEIPKEMSGVSYSSYHEYNDLDKGLVFVPQNIREKYCRRDIIDGGAFVGDSILNFIKYEPRKIYAFEPDHSNFLILNKNCNKINCWKNIVVPVNYGLGKCKSKATIQSGKGAGTKINFSDKNGQINIIDIDSYIFEQKIQPGVIKLDLEGCEYDVIQGSVRTIKEFTPILLISIYHTPKDFFHIKPFIDSLKLGYKFLVRKCDPYYPYVETTLICYHE
jgi:FkbM family methyltransferase